MSSEDSTELEHSEADAYAPALDVYRDALERGDNPDSPQWRAGHPEVAMVPADYLYALRLLRARAAPGLPPRRPRVPGYEILSELGRGGMGVVYKALQVPLNREVALKMILAGSLAGDEDRKRFLAEAEAIAAVKHPGIVQVYDFGTHEDLPYFSLEFCEGGSLARKLAGTPVSPREAAHLVGQVARAVQAAHQHNIVHRDLKPANVLLGADGSPKVSDFGLARRLEAGPGMTATGAVIGTPSYIAPEQAQGKKEVGPPADVYALGAILYETLTGRPPFKAATTYDTLLQVVGDEPVSPRQLNPQVPIDLDAVCLKCLHKDPRHRYGSAAELADDLGRFLSGEPTRARPVGRWERARRWVRRNPVEAAAVAAVAVAVVSLLAGAGSLAKASAARADAAGARALEADARAAASEMEARHQRETREDAERRGHETLVQAAQAAVQRGDWQTALGAFAKAIANNRPDRRRLEVARLPGLILRRPPAEAQRELRRLLRLADQLEPADAARVLLLHGESLLENRTVEARGFIRKALHTGQLSPADAAHAGALLSDHTTQALLGFRLAIRLEPAHPRAHHALLLTHVVRGELSEAREHARLVRALFPDDPVPAFAEAQIRVIEGDLPGALAQIEAVKAQLGEERYKGQRAFLGAWNAALQVVARAPAGAWMAALPNLGKMSWLSSPPKGSIGFNIPVGLWVSQRLAGVARVASAALWLAPALLGKGVPDWMVRQALGTVEPLCVDSPEPVVLTVLAAAYLAQADSHDRRKEGGQAIAKMRQAADVLHRAAGAPTILVILPVIRYQARFGALAADDHLLEFHRKYPGHAQAAEAAFIRARTTDTLAALLREGKRLPRERKETLTLNALAALHRDSASTLLRDWQRECPDDPTPGKLLVRLLLKRQDPMRAFSTVSELKQRFPEDRELQKLRQECVKQVREQSPDR